MALYITGGYQSSDITLKDANGDEVPWPGSPAGSTVLAPDTDYTFIATIHNTWSFPLNNIVVYFWRLDGGVGSSGLMLDHKAVGMPGSSDLDVTCGWPFTSAPLNEHRCAVVSIVHEYIPCPFASTSSEIADPTAALISPSNPDWNCSAWRNTSSFEVSWQDLNFDFNLGAGKMLQAEPIGLAVTTLHVPQGWEKRPEVERLRDLLPKAPRDYPLFLHSGVQRLLKRVDAGIDVVAASDTTRIERTDAGTFRLHAPRGEDTKFSVRGKLPRGTAAGDKCLITVAAYHTKTAEAPSRTVGFTMVAYVVDR
jgi:hypothetical protein